MRNRPIAYILVSIIALIFALTVLVFQFVRISIISGEMVLSSQLPMMASESASLLTVIESVIALLIPVTLVGFFVLLIISVCRKEASIASVNICLKLLIVPASLLLVSALQKTLYIYLYEGRFSIEYTWLELLISTTVITIYSLTVFEKLKSGYWLILACLIFVLVEVGRLSIPGVSYAYVINNNVYISTFVSAISFYFSYMFLGLSFILWRKGKNA
ncbi:MAG: hypothetical protein FWG91_13955 [Lachnospiraceae bacterium]|nr:hypothetical protein [Lachnospiraceae bacterium]